MPRSHSRSRGDDDRHGRDRRSRSRSRSPSDRGRVVNEKRWSRSPVSNRRNRRSRSRSRQGKHSERKHSRSRSKSRNRSRSKDRGTKRSRRHSRSRDSSVGSSSGSGVESRRKKEKRRDRDRKRSKSRERKKDKKKKKEKKKRGHGSAPQWGKYGVISETDIFTKTAEFHAWLVEERKINPETISKDQNRKEFLHFAEDFNTATLPHEKYYHMEAYERRMSALRQGEFIPPSDDAYDPQADMKALRGAHKLKNVEKESYLTREQLQELRRVQQERVEAGKMRLLGMDIKQNLGVRMDGTMFDD